MYNERVYINKGDVSWTRKKFWDMYIKLKSLS